MRRSEFELKTKRLSDHSMLRGEFESNTERLSEHSMHRRGLG